MADLQQWARETAPTMTDEDWRSVDLAVNEKRSCPELYSYGLTMDQCQALLAYRYEIAAGLSDDCVLELLTIRDGDGSCSLVDVAELLAVGLVRDVGSKPGRAYETTPFGSAVIHKLGVAP